MGQAQRWIVFWADDTSSTRLSHNSFMLLSGHSTASFFGSIQVGRLTLTFTLRQSHAPDAGLGRACRRGSMWTHIPRPVPSLNTMRKS